MQDLLDNPAVQAGIAPLVVALIIALLLARTPAAWLAIAAGYATMLALSTGLSFSPLTASRTVTLLGLLAPLVGMAAAALERRAPGRAAGIALSLAAGLAVLIVSDVVLATGQQIAVIMLGIALWGLHLGLTQGLLAAMVADSAPEALRGSAFGMFHFAVGLATLLASLLAGALWQGYGPALTFAAGAVFSAVALAGLLCWAAHRARKEYRLTS